MDGTALNNNLLADFSTYEGSGVTVTSGKKVEVEAECQGCARQTDYNDVKVGFFSIDVDMFEDYIFSTINTMRATTMVILAEIHAVNLIIAKLPPDDLDAQEDCHYYRGAWLQAISEAFFALNPLRPIVLEMLGVNMDV